MSKMKHFLFIIVMATSFIIISCKESPKGPIYNFSKSVMEDSAMVASAHPVATKIGVEVLKDGGNAADAAIAVHFALAVCYQVAGNIGGGGFLVFREQNGEVLTLDYREKAPAAATADMYLDEEGNPINEMSRAGHLAVGVPGSVDGMHQIFIRLSKLRDWKRLIQPAIDIARNGYKLTERQAKNYNNNKESFLKYNTKPTTYTSKTWKPGDVFKQEELAKTLEAIRDKGRSGFYEGPVADLIVEEMKRGGGLITHQDLADYKAVWRDAITFDYRGHTIHSMPPPSSGGIALAQLLQSIEPFDIGKMGFQSTEATHIMVEAERRAYADRAKHLGDSDYYDVPIERMTGKSYIADRFKDFNPEKASVSENIEAGAQESEQTTHYSIYDEYGNAVSMTTTLNGGFGSKTVVGGGGFFLNNEMDDFSAKPGSPNMFGLLGAEANKIEPGKRMLSSMTPTIVVKDGKPLLVVGTPGGSTIITSVFQVIVNVVDFGMTATEAVEAPRFHHQWKPDKIMMEEKALANGVKEKLESMGHEFSSRGAIGRVEAILIKNGTVEGTADIRGDDDVRGY